MRVIQVCPYAWNSRGGVQSHVSSLARELRARGHDVLVVAPTDPRRPAVPPGDGLHLLGTCTRVPVNGSVSPICLEPGAWLAVGRLMRAFNPDVVHVHEPLIPSLAMPAVWSSAAPVVATFHMHCPPSVGALLYSILTTGLRPWSRRIALSLAVSKVAAQTVSGGVEHPVHVVPNGVDVERFAGATPMAFPAGPKLLFVNRLDRRKGFDVALRAFAVLADRIEGLRFIVAGDGGCREALGDVPARIRERVIMLGDVPADELPSVYAAGDVFVAPARGQESFGIVLLEAMAAGLPIVASDIPGYREVVQHGRESLLVAPDNVEEVARAVARLLDSPALAAELAAAGRAHVAAFRWDLVAAQVERYYVTATERTGVRVAVPLPRVRPNPLLRSDD